MVKQIDSDIFIAPINILVHQANCFHTMGSGIARTIREKFPRAYEADVTLSKKGDRKKLGTYTVAMVDTPTIKAIVNLYSQFTFGPEKRQTDYEAFARGFRAVLTDARVIVPNPVIGVPYKIGCRLGGGDWNVIKAIIESETKDFGIDVIICKRPGEPD